MMGQALPRRYGHTVELAPDTPAVLLLHNAATPERRARVHAPTCSMLNTAKRGGVVMRWPREGVSTLAGLKEEIDDLNEMGYPVKMCKCLVRR